MAARMPDDLSPAAGRAPDANGGHVPSEGDVQRFWANVAGEVIVGWELAVEWDDGDHPTDWRTLKQDNPEDQTLLRERGLIEG